MDNKTLITKGLELLSQHLTASMQDLYNYGGDDISSAIEALDTERRHVNKLITEYKCPVPLLETLVGQAENFSIMANERVAMVSIAESDVAYGSVRQVFNGDIYQAVLDAFEEIDNSMSALEGAS